MPTPLRLLVAEDLPPDAELIIAEVRRAGYEPTVTVVDTAGKFLRALDDDPEIIICDYTMPTMTAPDALAILREKAPDLPLIVVSGSMDEATCVNSLRLGAVDYLLKDRLSRLGPAIAHALARRELNRTARAAEREREATMNDLRAARLELLERAESLDEANSELREMDRLKTNFIASVSHELRTPLTSIRGYAELLLDDASPEEGNQQTRMLGIIDRNARRLLSLVEDLLLLSQVDSQTLAHRVEPVDLAELADGAIIVLQPAAETAGVLILVKVVRPMLVHGDRSQLERVLFNLLSNAIKFSRQGHSVTIRGRIEPTQVILAIQDTGIGVPADELPKLFTRFFRSAADEAHNIPGTGLGLAVVREIIENHGGVVTMASTPGVGSTVTVTLPLPPTS